MDGIRPLSRAAVLAACLWLAACAGRASAGGAPEAQTGAPSPGGAAAGPFASVAFMAGCWRSSGEGGATVLEERYTPAEGGLMLGVSRFLRDGRAVSFEFNTLFVHEGGLVLTPYPNGERSEHGFRLSRSGGGEAVFEAPEHDYPKRILYRRLPGGGLQARIDAGEDDPRPRRWDMAPVQCG